MLNSPPLLVFFTDKPSMAKYTIGIRLIIANLLTLKQSWISCCADKHGIYKTLSAIISYERTETYEPHNSYQCYSDRVGIWNDDGRT